MSDADTVPSDDPILNRVIQSLDQDLRIALQFFSLPHWLDDAVLDRLGQHGHSGAAEFEQLHERGLVETWSEGVRAIRSVIRKPMLQQMLNGDPAGYRRLSWELAQAFSAVADADGDVFHHIESVFHRLAGQPEAGAEQMLIDGLTWKSEPFFAFEALAGLIAVAREQQQNGLLSTSGQAFLTLLSLFEPKSGTTARDEAKVLDGLSAHREINRLFDAELSLRRGLNHLVLRSPDEARAELKHANACFRDLEVSRGEADSLRALGRVELREDNLTVAKEYFNAAREIFKDLDLPLSAAYCVKSLGEADFYLGRYAAAEDQFKEALEAFDRNNVGVAAANNHVVYSQLLAVTGRSGEALEHIERAYVVYAAVDNQLGIGNCLKNAAVALFEQGRYDEARAQLVTAQQHYEVFGSETGLANCQLWTAACLTREQSAGEALPLLENAYSKFSHSGDRFGQASALRERGIALIALEHYGEGFAKLTQAQREFLAVGNEVEALASAIGAGMAVLAAEGPQSPYRSLFTEIAQEAQQVFQKIGHLRYEREARSLLEWITTQAAELAPPPERAN